MTLTLKNLWFYSSIVLEFSYHDFYQQLFLESRLFKINMLNLLFLRRFDGKYGSATAPVFNNFDAEGIRDY